jgi:hypothetical protein
MDWDAANAITFTGGRYRDACVGASGRFGLTCCWAVIANTEMTPNNAPIVDVARGIRVERLFVDFGLFETVSRAFHFIVQMRGLGRVPTGRGIHVFEDKVLRTAPNLFSRQNLKSGTKGAWVGSIPVG